MSARKSSHRTILLIVSSGSPLALIASSLRSISKKPFCPMARSLHPPMTACAHRVRFAGTWREEFFEAPLCERCQDEAQQGPQPGEDEAQVVANCGKDAASSGTFSFAASAPT